MGRHSPGDGIDAGIPLIRSFGDVLQSVIGRAQREGAHRGEPGLSFRYAGWFLQLSTDTPTTHAHDRACGAGRGAAGTTARDDRNGQHSEAGECMRRRKPGADPAHGAGLHRRARSSTRPAYDSMVMRCSRAFSPACACLRRPTAQQYSARPGLLGGSGVGCRDRRRAFRGAGSGERGWCMGG